MGVGLLDRGCVLPIGEAAQNQLHGDARPFDDGLSDEDCRIDDDPARC